MHLAPSFVTVASLSSASRLSLGLRTPATAAKAVASATSILRCGVRTNSLHATALRYSGTSIANAGERKSRGTCVVSAALAFLEAKKRIVECLSPADYAAVDEAIGASVGAHMRHSLDHFSQCLSALGDPVVDRAKPIHEVANHSSPLGVMGAPTIKYDQRTRGGTVETNPAEAAKVIATLIERLHSLPVGNAGSEILRRVNCTPSFLLGPAGAAEDGRHEHEFLSNLERELFFCCHHGTHHDAMIQLILGRIAEQGRGSTILKEAGETLGVAPSTQDFLEKRRGATAGERVEAAAAATPAVTGRRQD